MDFRLTDEQRQLRDEARRFAQAELPQLARDIEEKNAPLPRGWMKRYGQLGYLGINLPATYGGHGMSHLDAAIVLEEFAKVSPGVAFPIFESCFGPILAIAHFAPEALRKKLIPQVVAGEKIIAVSMSEPDAGSALTDLKTTARERNGHFRLNGQKRWCSGAGHADGYLVYCRMSDDPGAKGIGALYVEKGAKGFTFGKQEQLMGFRGVPSADMYFDEVEVAKENLVVAAGGPSASAAAADMTSVRAETTIDAMQDRIMGSSVPKQTSGSSAARDRATGPTAARPSRSPPAESPLGSSWDVRRVV